MTSTPALRTAILAIGTELTSGQIVNRNASWISQKLARHGIVTREHATVPDDRAQILDALGRLAREAGVLFLTGGLGPTSDDFTRVVLAEKLGLPLEWDEDSWVFIQDRLGRRGINAQEIQKQQCYYPQGSRILTNRQGTAHAFMVEAEGVFYVCLPGPPREIEAVWEDHLEPWLTARFPQADPWITRSWEILGQPESEVATRAVAALRGCPYEFAYRVHLPYVEFKLSYRKSQEDPRWLERAHAAFADLPVRFDRPDPADELGARLTRLAPTVLAFEDRVGEGYLLHRMQGSVGALATRHSLIFSSQPSTLVATSPAAAFPAALRFGLEPAETTVAGGGSATAYFESGDRVTRANFASPYSSSLLRDREKHYFVERAITWWGERLDEVCKGSERSE